jgi:hypothetical protein
MDEYYAEHWFWTIVITATTVWGVAGSDMR